MKNLKTLTIEQAEALNEYLENNPCYDRYDQPIEIDDLDINSFGDIVYAYSWKTREVGGDASVGFNSIIETYDEQYVTLITREQLLNEVISKKENA